MKRKSTIAFLLMIFISATLFASTISVEEAIELARKNNKQLQVERINLENSIRSASTISYLPSLSVSSTATLKDASIIDSTYTTGISPTIGATVSMSISNTDFLTHYTNKLTKQSAYNSYEQTVVSIENSVRTAYYNLVSVILAVERAESNLSDNKRSYEEVEKRYEGGKASSLELAQAELALYDANLSYDYALTTEKNARTTLGYLIGEHDFEVERTLPEERELKSIDEIKGLITSSLSYQGALISVSQAEDKEKNLKASTVYPKVTVSASYKIGNAVTGPYKTAKASSDSWSDSYYDNANVSVGVSLPLDHLLPHSTAKANLQNANSNVTKAEISAEKTLDSLNESVEKSYRSVVTALDNIEKYEKYLDIANKKLALTEAAYEGGKSTYKDLTDVKSDRFEAEIALLDQRLTYITALSSLATTLGVEAEILLK